MTPGLLVMLKAPRAGEVKSRLAATLGAPRATAVYRRLVERQMRALPAGWPVTVHFAPASAGDEMRAWLAPLRPAAPPLHFLPQVGGSLGKRLAAAFDAAFAGGAAAAIALGGDCPGLDAAVLQSAADSLAHADAVLGPATDGGYYLIGLRGRHPEIFRDIEWSSPEVLGQTRSLLRAAGLRTHELAALADIDTAADLAHAVAAGKLPAWITQE